VVHNGVYNNWSWSLGQFHFQSDGYRENNDLDQNIYDLFVQGALSYQTSVQAELRHSDGKNGDLTQRFEPDDFDATQREQTKFETARLGLHHLFSPGSEVIASLIYLHDSDDNVQFGAPLAFPPFGTLTASVDAENPQNNGYTAEIQHLYQASSFKLVSGAGYFTVDGKLKSTANFTLTPPSPVIPDTSTFSDTDQNWDHKNAYVYANIPYRQTLTMTAGASYDDLSLDQNTETTTTLIGLPVPPTTSSTDSKIGGQKLNPKLGLTWQAMENTTLRAAAFRTITRSVISSQTIEPTQVAGFNQFYNDATGTKADVYGLAVDQVVTSDLSTGLEYTWRDTEVPYLNDEVDWDEGFGRAYVYWTPTQRVATSAEYQYEDFKRDQTFTGEFQATQIQTQRVPLTVNYFHPSGFFSRLRTTYYDQQGEFASGPGFLANVPTTDKNDQFWLVDASVGYRLPKRYGFISAGVINLFDENFKFVDTDPFNPRITPERLFFTRLTLSF
jgi:hypothetical protein